ncbi:hypothetical protein K3495_g12801 [Podosphaera aphanis]|nr:hypothetical protein K3495_g12801 [Podosphaera aphanis]
MTELFAQSRQDDDLFADEYDQSSSFQTPDPKIQTESIQSPGSNSDNRHTKKGRGDRSLTGGLSKVRLTDAELSAKLEKMRIINAAKLEKHLLQAADQAAFEFRDEELVKETCKKERERVQRLEMEKERMKNRERKIKSISRREWDVGKDISYRPNYYKWTNDYSSDERVRMESHERKLSISGREWELRENSIDNEEPIKAPKKNQETNSIPRNPHTSDWTGENPIDNQEPIVTSKEDQEANSTPGDSSSSDWTRKKPTDNQEPIIAPKDNQEANSPPGDAYKNDWANENAIDNQEPMVTSKEDEKTNIIPKGLCMSDWACEDQFDSQELMNTAEKIQEVNNSCNYEKNPMTTPKKEANSTPRGLCMSDWASDNPYEKHGSRPSPRSNEGLRSNSPRNNQFWTSSPRNNQWWASSPNNNQWDSPTLKNKLDSVDKWRNNQRNSMLGNPNSKSWLPPREEAYTDYMVFGNEDKKPGKEAEVCVKIPASVMKLLNFKGK